MEPKKFRESRQAIKGLCENTYALIEQKEFEASKACYQDASAKLDILKPQAEGEIQERSVKNLVVKVNTLSKHIKKMKAPKKSSGRAAGKNAKPAVVWDEAQIKQLTPAFLKKVFLNMKDDAEASVRFGTTGKGVRPNYLIEFSNQTVTSFSGSSHKPLEKKSSATTKKISQPFPRNVIDSILNRT